MAELNLKLWPHPSMQLPFKLSQELLKMPVDATVADLMDKTEESFEAQAAVACVEKELQINVLWNVKDHKKALNPSDKLNAHFADNDTFGIYGDIFESQSQKEISEELKTPVTILTGFLGSGKTTLLNYILQEQSEKKIAIIENEFGEVSIDDALLKKDKMALAEKIVMMDNGCMCCTLRGDLINGLKEILAEMHKGSTIDAIIIETTGMADPVPIVRTFMSSPEITQELRLDGVIAVADARNLPGRLDDEVEEGKVNEAYQQIAFADKILLNKLDLINTEQAISVKDRIRSINSFAKILPAVRGRVKLSELSNMRAHDMANFADTEDFANEAPVPDLAGHTEGGHGGHAGHSAHGGHGQDEANCSEEHGGGHAGHGGHGGHGGGHDGGHAGHDSGHAGHVGHGQGENRHDNRVNSFSIVRDGEIVPRKLAAWMKTLGSLPAEKGTVFRIKAILAVKGHPLKHVFHAVMDVSDEDDAGPWEAGEKKISKIVFIGKSMDQKFLRDGFSAIFE